MYNQGPQPSTADFELSWPLTAVPADLLIVYKNEIIKSSCVSLAMTCTYLSYYELLSLSCKSRGCRDRMVVGFTNICAISAYHH